MNPDYKIDKEGLVAPTGNQIDLRRHSPLGPPFFLSKAYKNLDREKAQIQYIGHIYFGNRSPLIASLKVAETMQIGIYIAASNRQGETRFWTDCSSDRFLESLDEMVLKTSLGVPFQFILSDELDAPICMAYLHHCCLRFRIAGEKATQDRSPSEEAAIAKYKEDLALPKESRGSRKRGKARTSEG